MKIIVYLMLMVGKIKYISGFNLLSEVNESDLIISKPVDCNVSWSDWEYLATCPPSPSTNNFFNIKQIRKGGKSIKQKTKIITQPTNNGLECTDEQMKNEIKTVEENCLTDCHLTNC